MLFKKEAVLVELWQGASQAGLRGSTVPEVLTVSVFFLSQGLRTAGMTLLPSTGLPRRKRYSVWGALPRNNRVLTISKAVI